MRVTFFLFVLLVASGFLLSGCASLEPPIVQNRVAQLPSFDQSNAALIDKDLAGLQIAEVISAVVQKNERCVVVSMEDTVTKNFTNYNYLVEDNLISSLLVAGFKLLERDENLIVREIPEAGDPYNRALLRVLPTPPSIVLLDAIEKNGLSTTLKDEKLSLADILSLYKQLNDDYRALIAAQDHMKSADVIISYRLLELGIRAETSKVQVQATSKDGSTSPESKVWAWQISRDALARLFIRVMDAKTGDIRAARVLQNELANTTTITQDSAESDSDFDNRANAYLASLSKYHYSWYEQQLPNKNGNPPPQDNVIPKTERKSLLD